MDDDTTVYMDETTALTGADWEKMVERLRLHTKQQVYIRTTVEAAGKSAAAAFLRVVVEAKHKCNVCGQWIEPGVPCACKEAG
jgi:hypothetical protein